MPFVIPLILYQIDQSPSSLLRQAQLQALQTLLPPAEHPVGLQVLAALAAAFVQSLVMVLP